eukprot:CAMPEP_0176438920 /NCGR_PEP_ID=MMETSP0127-20121128/19605_1 /TAXON_ID=938130 /ORGANISM="Platyophrya macrostoma, Strain WH" /LENGTH=253 /DNA_ID=CAMNT_0017823031 /DNA_START=131 /DNA_END=892 /DNA_ORIENTATION=+
MTSRNESLGKTAMSELLNQNPAYKDSLYFHALDITNKETYSPFFDWIKTTFGKFDVLVNNAGVLSEGDGSPSKLWRPSLSEASRIIGTNYTATREFTESALPNLSDDGKIIQIASTRGLPDWQGEALFKRFMNPEFKEKELEEIHELFMDAVTKQNFEEVGITWSCYNISKALQIAWTQHVLPKMLKGEQQTFSLCPGWCRTAMGGENAPLTAEEGTETIEYLIDLPYKLNKEINGRFFRGKKLIDLDEPRDN